MWFTTIRHICIHICPNSTLIQNDCFINYINHMNSNTILRYKCAFLMIYIKEIPRISNSDIYRYEYNYGYETPAFSINSIQIRTNFVSIFIQITTTLILTSSHHTHNHTITNTLHKPFRPSNTTKNLPQFTNFFSKTHINHTMWGQYKKSMAKWLHCIMNARVMDPGHSTILKHHWLATLDAYTLPKKKTHPSKK